MIQMPEFKRQIGIKRARMEEKQAKTKEKKLGEAVTTVLKIIGQVTVNPQTQATTQLVKAQIPLVWVGQKLDKWKLEVEKWKENNRSTDERSHL